MRVNDRTLRDELRRQAMSVPIPDQMWATISRELDRDAQAARVAAKPASSSRLQIRQMLAIGAAAGLFWLMVIPSGAYVDKAQGVGSQAVSLSDTPWDIPSELRTANRRYEPPKSMADLKRPSPENTAMR